MSETKWPRTFFKLPPEMGDGQHWSLCDSDDCGIEILLEHVRVWAQTARHDVGEAARIEVVQYGKREFERLPEI